MEQQRLEQKKKEQRRALERLQELDSLHKRNQDKIKKYEESDKSISITTSHTSNIASLKNKPKLEDYNDMYNPYKVKRTLLI